MELVVGDSSWLCLPKWVDLAKVWGMYREWSLGAVESI